MAPGDELRRAVRGQAREVPRGAAHRQGLGDLEQAAPPRPVGDGRGRPPGRLQDQEGVQEAGQEEGRRSHKPHHGVREARERGQALGVLGLSPGEVDPARPVFFRRPLSRGAPSPSKPPRTPLQPKSMPPGPPGPDGTVKPLNPPVRSPWSGHQGLSYKTGGRTSYYLPPTPRPPRGRRRSGWRKNRRLPPGLQKD